MVLGFNGATTLTADLAAGIRAAKPGPHGWLQIWIPKPVCYFVTGSLSGLRGGSGALTRPWGP